MKLNLSSPEQRASLFAGFVGVVILWIYGVYLVGPLLREAGSLSEQVRSAREQLRTLEAATSNEAVLRDQHRQLNETVASLRKMLPPEEEIPAVIEHLSDLASQTGVRIQVILPQHQGDTPEDARNATQPQGKTASGPVVFKEVPIQIDALAGYHELGAFLSLVESGEKPMLVSSLRISGSKDLRRQVIKVILRSYFAVNDAGLL